MNKRWIGIATLVVVALLLAAVVVEPTEIYPPIVPGTCFIFS